MRNILFQTPVEDEYQNVDYFGPDILQNNVEQFIEPWSFNVPRELDVISAAVTFLSSGRLNGWFERVDDAGRYRRFYVLNIFIELFVFKFTYSIGYNCNSCFFCTLYGMVFCSLECSSDS